jgi:hypothetical protein
MKRASLTRKRERDEATLKEMIYGTAKVTEMEKKSNPKERRLSETPKSWVRCSWLVTGRCHGFEVSNRCLTPK